MSPVNLLLLTQPEPEAESTSVSQTRSPSAKKLSLRLWREQTVLRSVQNENSDVSQGGTSGGCEHTSGDPSFPCWKWWGSRVKPLEEVMFTLGWRLWIGVSHGQGLGVSSTFPAARPACAKALWQGDIFQSGKVTRTVACDEGEVGPVAATGEHSASRIY